MTVIKNSTALNIILWIAQAFISIVLLMAGFMKLLMPVSELSINLAWTAEMPELLVRILGLTDIAGGLGIVLPSLLRIKPQLTPLAAKLIILLMISAIVFHISRGEASLTGFNFIIILLALFVTWGRLKKVPIQVKKNLKIS